MTASQLVHLAVAVIVLFLAATAVLRLAHIPVGRGPLVSLARGAVQLAAVGLLLRGVIAAPPAVAVALAVMVTTASVTTARRLRRFDRPGPNVVAAILAGASLALVIVFGTGALPFEPRYLIALGGIVIGGTMTAGTLAGRHLLAGIVARREEVEGWLALGATSREALQDVVRLAAAEALVPGLDQTRTTGLVTLPGAFVGALLGGANPLQAARFQLVVLAGLLCAQATTAVVLTWLLGAPARLPLPTER
ncbi:MAG: ABC transporter permease [Actinomycetales bacterium]